MNIDKFSKIVWLIIGSLILFGMILGLCTTVFSIFSFNRYHPDGIEAQIKKGQENQYILKTVYEMPLLTEGSDFFVVPVSLKKVSKDQETKGAWSRSSDTSSSWGSGSYSRVDYMGYSFFNGPCHNLIFINKKSGQAEKLLNERAYIDSVFFPDKKYLAEEKTKPTFILLEIAKKDTNGDGTINNKDALAGYLVGLDGKGLTQITPSDTNMVSWRYDQDSKKLFVKVVEDTNGDKKFTEEDNEKILIVDTDKPGMGQELVPEDIKKDIDHVIHQ